MMRDEHIDFSKLEPGDSVDERHLEGCRSCRLEWEAYLLMRRQAQQALEMDPPPFFAARVARLALEQQAPAAGAFPLALQQAARRLLPVFMTLLVASLSIAYWLSAPGGFQGAQEDWAEVQYSQEESEAFAALVSESWPEAQADAQVFDLLSPPREATSHEQ